MKRILAGLVVAGFACTGPAPRYRTRAPRLHVVRPPPAAGVAPEPIVDTMAAELARSMTELGKQPEPPYFVSYEVTDLHATEVSASHGRIEVSSEKRTRSLDVDVRVGDHTLDNTRNLDGRRAWWRPGQTVSATLPIEHDPYAITSALWSTTDQAYKRASIDLARARVSAKVRAKREDDADDFSRESPAAYFEAPARLEVDLTAWERRIERLSAGFSTMPDVLRSGVWMSADATTRYHVNSDGTRVQEPTTLARLGVYASVRTDDGSVLGSGHVFTASSADRLPADEVIAKMIEKVIAELTALRHAPTAEPYAGPVILEGRAAAVFVHEVFGHRIEGHRQKDDTEGQTFAKQIGKSITSDLISIIDDPSIASLNGIDLNGFYRYDSEGVAAERTVLVENGVLKTFLLGRSPARGFSRSNGHGRRQPGRSVVARQANLIVAPSRVISRKALRRRLLAEVARQRKPYGLIIRAIDGGHTRTDRYAAQAFKLLPVTVYRLYPDGREELVRGADLEGTPVTALANIIAAGGEMEVFNGYCGAESGFIPVSGSSPSLLLSHLEVTRRAKGDQKPPILPPPPRSSKPGGAP